MINLMRGFAALPVLMIVIILGVLAAGTYFYFHQPQTTTVPIISSTPSPIVSTSPTSTASASAKVTPKPTNSPSPTPEPERCEKYDLKGNFGNLTITIKPDEGKTLTSDTKITIKRVYPECRGVDPGFPISKIIKPTETSTKFDNIRPGPFHIDVSNQGKTSGYDVDIHSSDNSLTVPVSE